MTGFTGVPQAGAGTDETECFDLLTPGGNIISTSRKHAESGSSSENWYTFNRDYNGSTTSIISSSGSAVSTYGYDAYGNITEISDDIDNEVCYTGQIYDEGTGLHYYNARYYDSEGACFTSMDTYRGDSFLPQTLNLYMYCGGDPVNYTDPSGHGFLKLFKKLVKVATKSSSRKASRKTTKKSTHRASATVRRKAVVKRVDSAAKKVKKKVKKAAKKAKTTVQKCVKKNRDTIIKSTMVVLAINYITLNHYGTKEISKNALKQLHYERNTITNNNELIPEHAPNLKIVSAKKKNYEAVYYHNGQINTTPEDMGTYNYGTNKLSHAIFDIAPYFAFGNVPNDSTNIVIRSRKAVEGLKQKLW